MKNKISLIRILPAFAVFLLLILSVAMCNKTTTESNPDNELIIWGIFDDKTTYAPMLEQYQSDTGITVKYYKIAEDVADYEDLLLNELAEGKGPDIFMFPNTSTQRYLGKLTPLPKDLGITTLGFTDRFVPVVGEQLVVEDNVYGMPMYVDTLALYFNKNLYGDYVPSRGQPAETWQEIADDTEKITETNRQNLITQSAIALGRADNISRAVDILYLMLLQGDVRFYDLSGTRADFATDDAITILDYYLSFGDGAYRNFTWDEQITKNSSEKEVHPFVRGQLASMLGYSYLYSDLTSQINSLEKKGEAHISLDDIGIVKVPGKETSGISLASYFPFGVSKNSDSPRQAWQLISYLTEKQNLQAYHEATQKPTPIRDLIDQQSNEEIYGVFAQQVLQAQGYDFHDDEYIYDVIYEMIDDASKGKVSPKNALLDAQARITQNLENYRKVQYSQ